MMMDPSYDDYLRVIRSLVRIIYRDKSNAFSNETKEIVGIIEGMNFILGIFAFALKLSRFENEFARDFKAFCRARITFSVFARLFDKHFLIASPVSKLQLNMTKN